MMKKRKLISLIVVMSLLFQIISVPLAQATEHDENAANQSTQEERAGGDAEGGKTGGGTSTEDDDDETLNGDDPDGETGGKTGGGTPTEDDDPAKGGNADDKIPDGGRGGNSPQLSFNSNSILGGGFIINSTIPYDLTPPTDPAYLIIHRTDYISPVPPTDEDYVGPASSITITPPGGGTAIAGVVDGDGITFNDIPDGADISMKIVFHLDDGEESDEPYTYTRNHYFRIALPEGIDFQNSTDSGNPEEIKQNGDTIATWYIDDTGSGSEIVVRLTEAVEGQFGIWGEVNLEGTFSAFVNEEDKEREIILGDQVIKFIRAEKPEGQPTVNKVYSGYDAAENTITWTVTLTPPEDNPGYDFSGHFLTDAYSANQTYVAGSFMIGTASIDDDDLELGTNHVIYTFPSVEEEPIAGTQVITYKTRPTDFSAEGSTVAGSIVKASTFENEAFLGIEIDEEISVIIDSDDDSATFDWIAKEAPAVTEIAEATEGYDVGDIIIKWTVTVTVPGSGSIDGAKIVDTLSPGMVLIAGDATRPITIKINDDEATTVPDTGYGYDGTTLTYGLADGFSGTATLTYYTKLPAANRDDYLDDNNAVTFPNKASFEWSAVGVIEDGWPSDVATAGVVGSGGIISKTSTGREDFEYGADGTDLNLIKWTIKVNENRVTINSASITDTISAGQELYITSEKPFTVTGGGTTATITASGDSGNFVNPNANSFTYNFGTITGAYTVEYYTKITDFNTLYSNSPGDEPVEFGNKVELYRGTTKEHEITGTKQFNSQVLKKSNGVFNYDDRTAKWTIVVNRNQLPMTGAVVTDTIPVGMVLFIDSTHPFTVDNDTDGTANPIATAPTTGTSGSTSFEYSFGAANTITDQYTITFYTKVTDDWLIAEGQFTTHTFENEAILKQGASPGPEIEISSKGTVSMKNSVITKEALGEDKTADGKIDWRIVINLGKVNLTDAKVTDALGPILYLMQDSVKLYAADINEGTGAASKSGDPIAWGTGENPPRPNFDLDTSNTLTVNLPNGPNAYILEFTTLLEDNGTINNKVVFSMGEDAPLGSAKSGQINVSNLWGTGGAGSQRLAVKKVDEEGIPLSGAKFQLYNKSGNVINGTNMQATTGADGIAVFTGIPNWAYYIGETEPPTGYLLNTAKLPAGTGTAIRPSEVDGVTWGGDNTPALNEDYMFTFENVLGVNSIEFMKTGENGGDLEDAVFTLTGTSVLGEEIDEEAESDEDGLVSFTNIPMGIYILKEVSAPNGYWLPQDEYTITIGYNNDKTGTVVSWTLGGEPFNPVAGSLLREISNEVAVADVVFDKTGVEGALLDGGTFILSGTRTLDNEPYGDDAVAVGGKVTFEGVPIGEYEIKETEAPDGYLPSKKIIEVKVSYEDEENQSGIKVEYRFKNTADPDDWAPISELELINLPIPDVEITKHDANGEPLEGAKFALFDSDDGQVQGPISSGADGKVLFEKVLPGEYTIVEVDPVNGYLLLNKVINVRVSYDENATLVTYKYADSNDDPTDDEFIFVNVEGRADVSFNKLGVGPRLDENGVPLSDGTFRLMGESILFGAWGADDENPITASPDENGLVTFADIPMGTYTIAEVDPPTGYLYSGAIINVSVEYAGDPDSSEGWDKTAVKVLYWFEGGEDEASETVRTFVNERGVGDIEFTKTGWEGELLSGGIFRLEGTSDDGFTVVDETAVAEDGAVKFTDVPMGTYTITEVEAPDGYLKPGDYIVQDGVTPPNSAIEVRIVYADEEKTETKVEYRWLGSNEDFADGELEVENWLIPSLKLIKVNEAGEPLSHAVFVLYDSEGEFVQKAFSNRHGVVMFERVLPGDYTIKEVRSPIGYDPWPDPIPVTVKPGADVDVIELGNVINTQAELGAIRIIKVSSTTGKTLLGATFGLYDTNGKLLATAITDSDGIAEFRDLYPGKYIIRETSAPGGYLKDETGYEISVDWRTVHEITVKNEPDPNCPTPGPFPTPTPGVIVPGPSATPSLPDSYVPGSKLPQAGELWDATLISILGGALILGGLTIVIVKRRRSVKG